MTTPNKNYIDEQLKEIENEYTLSAGDLPKNMIVMPVKDAKTIVSSSLKGLLNKIEKDFKDEPLCYCGNRDISRGRTREILQSYKEKK